VVGVAHHRCREDEWISKCQWRLSFSRAEIVLLNSWMPIQQIVYHTLRFFVKNERLTDSAANNSVAGTLSNYHIKTLMLWACELKSRSWWTDDLNLVRICVELLHTLAVWLTDARCQHYFIYNCNLFDRLEVLCSTRVTVDKLRSISRAWFCQWCIDNYIHECAQRCSTSVSSLLRDCLSSSTPHDGLHRVVSLQKAVEEIVKWRHDMSLKLNSLCLSTVRRYIMNIVRRYSLTLRSCLCWLDHLARSDHFIRLYFAAIVFLHIAHKTTQSTLTDEMLHVLVATCLQLNDVSLRRCLNVRHGSALSLSQAAVLMNVVANNSRSTVQLIEIEIELSKAYLYRALRYKDSNSDSVYCLANVYLAVLYYTTEQYQTAIDHCTLVTRLQDHSQCSSSVVQGKLLPRIDYQVDSVLGLAVFYQYIRAAALNRDQESRHLNVFTTELFAHYFHIKLLSLIKCRQLPLVSVSDDIRRYKNCLCNSREITVIDVIVFGCANRAEYPSNDRLLANDRSENSSLIRGQLDTYGLVELLQQSAVEHLTSSRELEAEYSGCLRHHAVTTDYSALYAYKCGQFQLCLQLSVQNARTLIGAKDQKLCPILELSLFPELLQLMDDDIVSLTGVAMLVKALHRSDDVDFQVSQLSLSLYLMTRCQIKLRHSVTSMATTLHYIRLAHSQRFNSKHVYDIHTHLLKFTEQKILTYMAERRGR